MFTISDDESPVRHSECHHQHSSTDVNSPVHRRAELPSPVHHNLCHSLTPTPTTEQFYADFDSVAWDDDTTSTEEHFPTAPLNEESGLKTQLFVSMSLQHYNLQNGLTTGYHMLHYEQMDFSDISSDFPDIMMTTSDDDIPHLEDISNSEHMDNIQHEAQFA